jgi:glycosyltransferase involved in cell wall biosynthesis
MCYPGTLSWHQGVDLAISAMALLRDKAPKLKLLILGDGTERERLVALAEENGLADRVTISGGVSIEKVAWVMSSVDLGVEPKRKRSFANEALSTKILEFMAMGVPVLASDTHVHQLYFDNLIHFFESENIENLAATILALMHDPTRRDALCKRGTEFILENNWDVKKHEYLDLVDRLICASTPTV